MKKSYLIAAVLGLVLGISTGERGFTQDGRTAEQSLAVTPDSVPLYGHGLIFRVAQQGYSNPYLFWVANKCSQRGIVVSARYMAISWQNLPPTAGVSGPFILSWLGGPADCTAYVYESPYSEIPLASVTYSVDH